MDEPDHAASNVAEMTCDDCFFRQAELCALPGNTPCPTFRAAQPDGDAPPPPSKRPREPVAA